MINPEGVKMKYWVVSNSWRSAWGQDYKRSDDNGFVRDKDNKGIVYQPDASETSTPPAPLDQPKSSTNDVEATIKASIRIRRFLHLTGIEFNFCDLGSKLFAKSKFLYSLNNNNQECDKCSESNKTRTAHYFSGFQKLFYQNQEVTDLINVNYCEVLDPETVKPVTYEPPTRYDCKQNLRKCKYYRFGNHEPLKPSNCSKIVSMIVGFGTSLDICKSFEKNPN